DCGREALGAREARWGPEGVPGGMAEALRPGPRAPDCATPSDQGPGTDLPHAATVRLRRENGGPCLHDDEGPAAVVPRRDQRGSPGGHETWGEGATRGGRYRNRERPRFGKKTICPLRGAGSGRRFRLSKRIVGLTLLAMALVTAAFAVTVARADDQTGSQWNAVLAGINERPTPRDTHARGV